MSLKVTRCRIRQDNTVCQVVLIESARPPDRQVRLCVGVRPAVAPAAPAPRDTLRRRTHLPGGRADLIHTPPRQHQSINLLSYGSSKDGLHSQTDNKKTSFTL